MPVLAKNFLTLESTSSAVRSNWSAERSALVADALRNSGSLPSRVRLRVHGESMLPALWPGDVVEIANCSLAELRPGEIVLALREGRLFLHRFVAPCTPHGFVLRGDSMPGPDPVFLADALLGRLVNRVGLLDRLNLDRLNLNVLSRALGMLFCHCSLVRRFALRLHSLRKTSPREFLQHEAARLTPTEFVSRELGTP
jgi:signal peptidase I